MSEEQKMVTEHDAVMRERAAFRNGAGYVACCPGVSDSRIADEARDQYPLRVTRPRVVADSAEFEWTIRNGSLCWRRRGDSEWRGDIGVSFPDDRIPLLADLFARPTETVDAE